LKRESLKSYFDPSLYVNNFFLREHPRSFFPAIGKAMLSILRMVVRGRQPEDCLDI